jgi:signal transduction histidine kinase
VLRKPPLRLYGIAWVPLAVVYAVLFTAAGASPGMAMRGAIVSVLPCALLGLLVLRIPSLLPWREDHRAGFFVGQLGLTVVYGVAGTTAVLALRNLESLATTGHAIRWEPMTVAWQTLIGGLIYLVIAGGAYAWQNAQRMHEETARAARAEVLRAQAELQAIRSQLNPHFLLNTLHAALGLVRRDPALAERALVRLGEVLHYGLRMHRESLDQVTLADEWAFVESYLEIESLRLEERLQLQLEADPEAMQELVPPFVLQPLVENAILHAVAPRKAGGRVVITARRLGDSLRLEVCDDGPGLPRAPLRSGNGLGLRLLRERLALLYAGRASLSLQAADSGGVRATIELPLDREAAVGLA